MSILSLDYGTKHIGLAISDETLSIAVPLDPLQAEPFGKFIGKLKETIRQFEDERLSTKLADRLLTERGCHGKEKKRRIDSCAAAVVLQSYLDGLLLKE